MKINGKQYYDIVTPYGYGGPYIVGYVNKEKDGAVTVQKNRIVTGFFL